MLRLVTRTGPKNSQLTKLGSERKKNYVGRGNSPYTNKGKGDTLAQRSRESSPPRKEKTTNHVCCGLIFDGIAR
eukprot:1134947-Pelagomonas_calceolata.AAC.1